MKIFWLILVMILSANLTAGNLKKIDDVKKAHIVSKEIMSNHNPIVKKAHNLILNSLYPIEGLLLYRNRNNIEKIENSSLFNTVLVFSAIFSGSVQLDMIDGLEGAIKEAKKQFKDDDEVLSMSFGCLFNKNKVCKTKSGKVLKGDFSYFRDYEKLVKKLHPNLLKKVNINNALSKSYWFSVTIRNPKGNVERGFSKVINLMMYPKMKDLGYIEQERINKILELRYNKPSKDILGWKMKDDSLSVDQYDDKAKVIYSSSGLPFVFNYQAVICSQNMCDDKTPSIIHDSKTFDNNWSAEYEFKLLSDKKEK